MEPKSTDPDAPVETDTRAPLSRATLPSAHQMLEMLEDFEQIWQRLVPRSVRPASKGLHDRVRRQLLRIQEYVVDRGPQIAAGGLEGEDSDEPPLVHIMRIVRTLSPEQWEQVKILMSMRELSDEGRAEMFYEMGETHDIETGEELGFEDEGDDDDDEDEPVVDGPTGTKRPAAIATGANGPGERSP